mmetsp:Transcript_546/g.1462  ORF Transcript_546/g.1462 Transcript_546/m.1462 type:complete len:216 (-) Transcript_546:1215-1862(-)
MKVILRVHDCHLGGMEVVLVSTTVLYEIENVDHRAVVQRKRRLPGTVLRAGKRDPHCGKERLVLGTRHHLVQSVAVVTHGGTMEQHLELAARQGGNPVGGRHRHCHGFARAQVAELVRAYRRVDVVRNQRQHVVLARHQPQAVVGPKGAARRQRGLPSHGQPRIWRAVCSHGDLHVVQSPILPTHSRRRADSDNLHDLPHIFRVAVGEPDRVFRE